LIWSVFFFCFFRSVGAAAMTTWFLGLLPPSVQGRYFASDQFLSGVGGVGTLIACAALFALLPIYQALLVQYVIALIGSTLSYYSLKRLPDIERPTAISLSSVVRDTPRIMFARSEFRRYLWLAVGYTVITTPIPPFAAYYLKVGPQLSAGVIMQFEVLRYQGVIAGAWMLRRRIDAVGAKPFFLLALGLIALIAVIFWLYLQQIVSGLATVGGLYFAVGFDFAGVSGSTWRLLVFYALAASMGTVWLWMTGTRHLPASQGGIFTVMLPISAALVGVLVLGETLTGLQVLAFGVALLGIVLTWNHRPSA
jgi:drug/metabolite transporter (DMT)-like permease